MNTWLKIARFLLHCIACFIHYQFWMQISFGKNTYFAFRFPSCRHFCDLDAVYPSQSWPFFFRSGDVMLGHVPLVLVNKFFGEPLYIGVVSCRKRIQQRTTFTATLLFCGCSISFHFRPFFVWLTGYNCELRKSSIREESPSRMTSSPFPVFFFCFKLFFMV